MSSFPAVTSVPFANPVPVKIRTKTLVSNFDDLGEETRKKKWLYPKRDVTLQYQNISKAEARTLWQFYLSRGGQHEAFSWFDLWTNTYEGEYVGTGDGSTTVFNLPSKQAASHTLYVDSAEQTGGGVDYTFSSGGGADGADKVTFTSAPADGERITFDFTGYLKVRCRFLEEFFDFETFYDSLVGAGVTLRGLLNA